MLTKVAHPEHRSSVEEQTQEMCGQHEVVPRPDCQHHHDQLSEDQAREGDGHDVHQLVLK